MTTLQWAVKHAWEVAMDAVGYSPGVLHTVVYITLHPGISLPLSDLSFLIILVPLAGSISPFILSFIPFTTRLPVNLI